MPPRPFLTQLGSPELLSAPIIIPTHPKPPKKREPGKTHRLTFHRNKEKKKRGREREPSPQDAARVGGGGENRQAPLLQLCWGQRVHSLWLQNLGYGVIPQQHIHGDLEERCRAGQGLGVSLLCLWPGEWLSPRWPLREPRSLLCWSRGEGWGEGWRRSAGE